MKRKALYLLGVLFSLVFKVSGETVFSNLDTADNRTRVRKTSLMERVRYSTFWNTDALPEDHLKISLDGVELLNVAAEAADQGHWFEINLPQKYEPQTVTLSHGLLVYTARFANGYAVRFDANGGTGLMDNQGFAYGESLNLLRNRFARTGYSFAGWSAKSGTDEVKYYDTECVADVTDALGLEPGALAALYAQWRPNVCHLVFHGNGGGGYMEGQDLFYDSETALRTNLFIREGYVFCGWARTADAEVSEFGNGVSVLNIESDDDVTVDLYAVWSPLKPDLADTRWAADGTADNRDAVRKATATEFVSYGTYWNTDAPEGTRLEVRVDDEVVKSTETGSEDVSGIFGCELPLRYQVQELVHEHGLLRYVARFANGYTVRFDGNGGLGGMDYQTFAYGEEKNIAANRFTKTGYTFDGWGALSGVSSVKFENMEVVEDITDALELEPGTLVTLYAQWRPNAYTVRFDANGGMGFADSQSMEYDLAVGLNTNVFTRTNCVFTGWSEDPNARIPTYGNGMEVKNLTVDDAGEIVLYAIWSPLRPDAAETAWTNDRVADNRSSVRKASATEYISYGTHWNTDAEDGTALEVSLDGVVIKTTETGSDDSAGVFVFEMPQRYSVQTMKHVHGLLSYSALFANGYTVRFDPNGGDGVMGIQEFAYGEKKNIASNRFVKPGYTFAGWAQYAGIAPVRIENAECVEDVTDALGLEPGSLVTLYAQWRANAYTVKFHANGGVGFADDQSMRYDESAALNTNAFSRLNCIFAGWSEDPDALLPTYANGSSVKNLSAEDEGVVELYAVWSRLRPDPVDTAWAEDVSADNRDGVRKASVVERISYGTGWNTEVAPGSVLTVALDGEILQTEISGDGVFECDLPIRYGVQTMTHTYGLLNYSAKFANGYKVRFDPNGGEGDMAIQNFAYGEKKNFSQCFFVKRGYNFAGWSSEPGEAEIKYQDCECVENITDALELEPGTMVVLYAQWKPNIYTIIFGANGGSGWMDSIRAAYDQLVRLVDNLFVKAGQIFAGWSTDADAAYSMFADKEGVLNLTDQDGGEVKLHAVWSQAKPNDVPTVWSEPTRADNRDGVRKATANDVISYGTYWNTDATNATELVVTVDGAVVKRTYTGSADAAGTFECVLPQRYEPQLLVHRHGLLLYAARFANGYTVRFEANGGSGVMDMQEFAYGERKNINPNRFVRNGYTFAGWSISPDGEILYENTECVEDVTDEVCLQPGSMVVLYAQWRPNVCKVEFHANGGAGYMDGQLLSYDAETVLARNGFVREGYVFCGWSTRADATVSEYWNGAQVVNITNENNAVVDFYAIWSVAKPDLVNTVWADERIADNCNGIRKAMASEAISYGTYWNTDAPGGTELKIERDGVNIKTTYSGSDDESGVSDCEMPLVYGVQTMTYRHGLLSLTARFATGYMVKFDPAGGNGEMTDQGFAYGEKKNLAANQFTRTGYMLEGWGTGSSANEIKFFDNECVEDVTDVLALEPGADVCLSAVWMPNTYRIRFNANGGRGEMSEQDMRYDAATALSENKFTREGYVFAGWAMNEWTVSGVYQDKGEVLNLSAVDGAVVDLYAVWSIRSPDPSQTAWSDIIAMLMDENFRDIAFADDSDAISLTDAGVAIKGSKMGDGQESVFSFTTVGNGQVSFEWRVSSEKGADYGWWAIDGVVQESCSGKDMNWTKVSRIISDESNHIWTFGYAKDESDSGGDDCAIFRGFKWTPQDELSSGDNISSAVIVADDLIVIDGSILGDAATASFSTNTIGRGKLIFRWTVSSEKDCDVGTYSMDGVLIGSMSGKSNPWVCVTNDVTDAGCHTWTFTYTKDSTNKSGSDAMSIADLVWLPADCEPIPELPLAATAAEVLVALEGSADAELTVNIKTAAEYVAYRTWALGLAGVTPEQVKSSPNAWLSFALDTDALITAAPKEGDVVIDTFEGSATDGALEFAVKIDGITVGDNALEVNLKKVFDIEGAESLASGGAGFSSDNVEVNTAAPENGSVKFTVTPKTENGEKPNSFFFRVKMK